MVEKILLIASVLGALGVIVATAVKVYKFIRSFLQEYRKWVTFMDEQREHSRENYLSILRLTIMSHEMPLSERIAAGEKYIKGGGNGEVKHKYEELLNQLPKEF